MFRFIIPAVALAAGLPPLVRWAWLHGWISQPPSFLYESTWLTAFFTTVIFIYLYRSDKPARFVQLYLLSMVVKLLAALTYCILVMLEDRLGAVANLLYFLCVYSLFTALEIAILYRKISPPEQAQK